MQYFNNTCRFNQETILYVQGDKNLRKSAIKNKQ